MMKYLRHCVYCVAGYVLAVTCITAVAVLFLCGLLALIDWMVMGG